MRPTIYGYLRVWPDTSAEDAARAEKELIDYAQQEGFTIAEIFVERPCLSLPAFDGLVQAITHTETKDIVIPHPGHLCPFPGLNGAMKAILEHIAGSRVWVIHP